MYRSCISAKTFADAYRHAFHATQRFLRSFGYSLEIAEEMAQAAWAKAWQHRRQLRNPESVAPWVNGIALNIIRDFDRAAKHKPMILPLKEPLYSPPCYKDLDLERALTQLTQQDRRLIESIYFVGNTIGEVATALGL